MTVTHGQIKFIYFLFFINLMEKSFIFWLILYSLSEMSICDALKPNYGDRRIKVIPNKMSDESVHKHMY